MYSLHLHIVILIIHSEMYEQNEHKVSTVSRIYPQEDFH